MLKLQKHICKKFLWKLKRILYRENKEANYGNKLTVKKSNCLSNNKRKIIKKIIVIILCRNRKPRSTYFRYKNEESGNQLILT